MHSPNSHNRSGPLAYVLECWQSLRTRRVWLDDVHGQSPPSVPAMPTGCAAAWPRCNLISRCSCQFNQLPSGISKQRAHRAAGKIAAAGPAVSATGGRDRGPTAFMLDVLQNRFPIESDRP